MFMFMFLCLYFLLLLITTVVPYLLLLAHGTHGTALLSKAMEDGRWIQSDSFYSLTHRRLCHMDAENRTRIQFSLQWGGVGWPGICLQVSCDLLTWYKPESTVPFQYYPDIDIVVASTHGQLGVAGCRPPVRSLLIFCGLVAVFLVCPPPPGYSFPSFGELDFLFFFSQINIGGGRASSY